MAIGFTPDQQKVIDTRNSNILVSAAAGSGKTAVLVERIAKMVCDEEHPVDIDRLLVVTFTSAAAAEMRERIGVAIEKKLSENPNSLHLQRQATLLHSAQITTIDSFSLFLLRNHFHKIGLDPAFRVADEGEIRLMQQDTLAELLEDAYKEATPAFEKCVESFCPGGKEKPLEDMILGLSRYASSFPWPNEWLEERKEDYNIQNIEELLGGSCGEYLQKYIQQMLEGCIEKLEEANALCLESDGPYMYGEVLEQEIEMLRSVQVKEDIPSLALALDAIKFDRLPTKKDTSVNVNKREYAKNLRNEVKKVLQEKLKDYFFATSFELALRQTKGCYESVSALIDLTIDFNRRMRDKKQEKKLVDFSDMEHFALDILWENKDGERRPSDVALEYRDHFVEILVDEYQDSNMVQEYLLLALSGEEQGKYNRFMVGDVKQSIYKFRLARPELFLEKFETYKAEGNFKRIDLAKNFRSRKEVLDSVNDIFEKIMSQQCGKLVYDESQRLYAGANYPENDGLESELWIVEKPGKEDGLNERQVEAFTVANRIKDLMQNFLVTDKQTGELRAARYSDMVILLRSNTGWDEEFKEVLEKQGIPVYITSKTGYFSATEVQELLNVLRVLCNPLQDIPLFGMMKSVFGGFTDEEIAILRESKKKCSLYSALKEYEDAPDKTKMQTKAQAFLEKIEHYRSLSIYLPIRELLWRLVDDHDYLNYVTALPAGEKRRANVEMLFTKASDFANTNYFGLFHFIRYIEQLEKYDVDFGEADILDENADVVRILSIHKSKGLEFPITFVAGMGKGFNFKDTNQSFLIDMELGVATHFVDSEKRIKNPTLRKRILSCKMREEILAEEERILYVALTRAKEKLIMTGSMANAATEIERMWDSGEMSKEKLKYLDFMNAGNYLDFVLPILKNTGIKLILQPLEGLAGEEMKEQIVLRERMEKLDASKEFADPTMLKMLQTKLSRVYAFENLGCLYTKTTVSELKIAAMSEKDEAAYHAFEEKEVVPFIPSFRKEEEKVSGTVRGNAYHRAMELLDFDLILSKQFDSFPESYEMYQEKLDKKKLTSDICEYLEHKRDELRLAEEYLHALRMQKIANFVGANIGYRMWRAQRKHLLYREQPFVLGISASRLKDTFPEEEKVLIQGIIDVFFVEDEKLVLLDYKTDVIESTEKLWERYETQILYYQEALERLMRKSVKEKILYSFYLEK